MRAPLSRRSSPGAMGLAGERGGAAPPGCRSWRLGRGEGMREGGRASSKMSGRRDSRTRFASWRCVMSPASSRLRHRLE